MLERATDIHPLNDHPSDPHKPHGRPLTLEEPTHPASQKTANNVASNSESLPRSSSPETENLENRPLTRQKTRVDVLALLSWLQALVVLVLLVLIRWVGASFWGTSLVIMLPRAVFLIPVAILAPISLVRGSRYLLLLHASTVLAVIGPLMGLSLPFQKLLETTPKGETVRVLTFNLSHDPIEQERLVEWLEKREIDVILIQEPHVSMKSLSALLKKKGWMTNEPRTIASRFKFIEELDSLRDESIHGRRFSARLHRARLETPLGRKIVVASAHMPTLRFGFEDFVETRRTSLISAHDQWWGWQLSRVLSLIAETVDEPMLIGGDFNLPTDDSRLSALRSSFRFAFEEAGWGYGYTRPSKFPWVRIDHVLSTPEWYVKHCEVGPDFGSDHLPLEAEYVLPAPNSAK